MKLKFEMAFAVCEFHITSHLFWASAGGATNSPSHVLYMGISYSQCAHRNVKPLPNQSILCSVNLYDYFEKLTPTSQKIANIAVKLRTLAKFTYFSRHFDIKMYTDQSRTFRPNFRLCGQYGPCIIQSYAPSPTHSIIYS